MALNVEYDKFDKRITYPEVLSQTIVESKIQAKSLYIDKILAVNTSIRLTSGEALSGEVRYGGVIYYSLIFQTENGEIDRLERATEFSHKVEVDYSAPSCKTKIHLSVVKTELKREGSSFVITSIVDSSIRLSKLQTEQYLVGGEEIIYKTSTEEYVKVNSTKGTFEVEDEIEIDYVRDILTHTEKAIITRAEAVQGGVKIYGEVLVDLCAVKEGANENNLFLNVERVVPFNVELPCDDVLGDGKVDCYVVVKEGKISANANEDRNRCKIDISLSLEGFADVYDIESIFCCDDAFSKTNELHFEYAKSEDLYIKDYIVYNERVNGQSALNGEINYDTTLQTIAVKNVECNGQVKEGCLEVEGVINSVIICSNKENEIFSVEGITPFNLLLKNDMLKSGDEVEVQAVCLGTQAKQKREGEIEIDSNLKICVKIYSKLTSTVICEVVEGEAIVQNKNALTVYVAEPNESLWSLSKKIKKSMEEVSRCNPELEFPLKGNERIIIYRKQETSC